MDGGYYYEIYIREVLSSYNFLFHKLLGFFILVRYFYEFTRIQFFYSSLQLLKIQKVRMV